MTKYFDDDRVILAALRTIAVEAREAALREAIKVLANDGWFCPQDAISALLATPAAPDPTTALARWRHIKRGTIYTEIGRGTFQLAGDTSIADEEAVVIYRGEDGALWVRPLHEFEDGRFERLALAERGG